MSVVDEIEQGLKYHDKWEGPLLVRRDDLAALCRYVRAAEAWDKLASDLSIRTRHEFQAAMTEAFAELQAARRELKLENQKEGETK